jgi:predicted RNA binding protein YcfA (HicA-like mRNA interferase family)
VGGNYYRDICNLLNKAGFVILPDRGHGSHEVWKNHVTGQKVTVVKNLSKRHTANAILKQVGLKKAF